jgi:hypothetical protein
MGIATWSAACCLATLRRLATLDRLEKFCPRRVFGLHCVQKLHFFPLALKLRHTLKWEHIAALFLLLHRLIYLEQKAIQSVFCFVASMFSPIPQATIVLPQAFSPQSEANLPKVA